MADLVQNRIEEDLLTPERLELFLDSLLRKGRQETTIVRYRSTLLPLRGILLVGQLEPDIWDKWKARMESQGLQPTTINKSLSALNSYLKYIGRRSWCGDSFIPTEQKPQPELSRTEYRRLLSAARLMEKDKAYLLIKLMGSFGAELKDLPNVTVEAVKSGTIPRRSGESIVLTSEMRAELLAYIRRKGIKDGLVFRTASGRVLDRKNVHWLMNSVCATAQVAEEKVSPRTLQRMYQQTRAEIHERVVLQAERDFQQLLFTEQRLFGWEEKKVARLP